MWAGRAGGTLWPACWHCACWHCRALAVCAISSRIHCVRILSALPAFAPSRQAAPWHSGCHVPAAAAAALKRWTVLRDCVSCRLLLLLRGQGRRWGVRQNVRSGEACCSRQRRCGHSCTAAFSWPLSFAALSLLTHAAPRRCPDVNQPCSDWPAPSFAPCCAGGSGRLAWFGCMRRTGSLVAEQHIVYAAVHNACC